MIVKALVSFAGKLSMMEGETRDIKDMTIVKDLLNAKYIEEVKTESVEKPKKRTVKKKTPKGE
jgi:hypothetical protein